MKTSEVDVARWAEIVIKEWMIQIQMLDIQETYALLDSFSHHVVKNSRGDVAKVWFVFNYYGKFVEMAVGRNFPIDFAKSPGNKREPKPWYTRTFMAQVHRLQDLLQQKYAEEAKRYIATNVAEHGLRGQKVLKGMLNADFEKPTFNNLN